MFHRLLLCFSILFGLFFIGHPLLAAPISQQSLLIPIESGWKLLDVRAPEDLSGHWAERVFQWGIRNRIIEGYSDGSYQPDRPVVESEFLLMFYRAYGVQPFVFQGEDWSDSPYRAASNWKHPALGLENNKARLEPMTRAKAAEIISAAQGVNFEGNDAILYLLGNHLANGKTEPTIEGFAGNDKVTRAEALQWIRNLKLNGALEIKQRPLSASDRSLLFTLPPKPTDELQDFTMIPLTVDDLQLLDRESPTSFQLGTLKSSIDAHLGMPHEKNVFQMDLYGSLGVHYDKDGRMNEWMVEDDGTDLVPPFQTSKGITVNVSYLSDVLRQYGTAEFEGKSTVDYLYEQVDGNLVPRFTRSEILHPDQAFVLSFIINEKTKKVNVIYVSTYNSAYSYP